MIPRVEPEGMLFRSSSARRPAFAKPASAGEGRSGLRTRVRPEPAIGPRFARTHWAGPSTGSGGKPVPTTGSSPVASFSGSCARRRTSVCAYSAEDCTGDRHDLWRATLLKYVAMGRNMNKSAISAAIIAKALSQPNRRSEGRLERTVMASPQASTADVKIKGGPTKMVARSTPTAGSGSISSICNRLRK